MIDGLTNQFHSKDTRGRSAPARRLDSVRKCHGPVVHMRRIAMAVPVALVALAGCTGTTSTGGRATAGEGPVESASPGRSSAAPSPASAVTADPRIPPQLPDAQETFIRTGGKTGGYAFPEIPLVRRGTLEVGVICSGSGTIDVKVGSFMAQSVACSDSGPRQLDQLASGNSHKNVAVSVTSTATGSWGLSVGWTKTIDPHG
ncbi:hypothetical protein [Streptomyces sp. NPDC088358]|uniref:hypothetical protein n=1 Tax=Streptomyces sp. NPDC088358 TaxID=3365857 RepID=UPI0038019878